MDTETDSKDLVNQSETNLGQLLLGLDGSALARAILNANIPEQIIQSLPPQALYMAIQANTLEDSQDLIAASTPEQYQIMLDFELWSNDSFNKDRFFNWVKIIDTQNSLQPLARFIQQVDQRLIAALICRYVQVQVNEEQTEPPTEVKAYSPDQGYTWISIHSGDADQDRMIGKILACIVNANPDYFYRLIYSQNVTTWSQLEEESYEDRIRRLNDQGIPDSRTAWEINSPQTVEQIQAVLDKDEIRNHYTSSYPIPHSLGQIEPLSSLLAEVIAKDEHEAITIESSLTTITNAGIIYYKVDFADGEAVKLLIRKIRGAINLGIESISKAHPELSFYSLYEKLQLNGFYRVGLGNLKKLKLFGRNIQQATSNLIHDPEISLTVDAISNEFPEKPIFLDLDQSCYEHLPTEPKAIETLAEVQQIRTYLENKLCLT